MVVQILAALLWGWIGLDLLARASRMAVRYDAPVWRVAGPEFFGGWLMMALAVLTGAAAGGWF